MYIIHVSDGKDVNMLFLNMWDGLETSVNWTFVTLVQYFVFCIKIKVHDKTGQKLL